MLVKFGLGCAKIDQTFENRKKKNLLQKNIVNN